MRRDRYQNSKTISRRASLASNSLRSGGFSTRGRFALDRPRVFFHANLRVATMYYAVVDLDGNLKFVGHSLAFPDEPPVAAARALEPGTVHGRGRDENAAIADARRVAEEIRSSTP